ncbi:MAG: hypothetical protein U0Z17_08605 [Bacteroidales bacterium]
MALLAAIVVTISCAPALYIPEKENVATGSTSKLLQAGRKTICEQMRKLSYADSPEKYTAGQWSYLVARMEVRG